MNGLIQKTRVLVLLYFILGMSILAYAGSGDKRLWDDAHHSSITSKLEEGYIELYFPVYNSYYDDMGLWKDSWLKVNGDRVLQFRSFEHNERSHQGITSAKDARFWITPSYNEGTFIVTPEEKGSTTLQGAGIEKVLWGGTQKNYTYWMRVRYYLPEKYLKNKNIDVELQLDITEHHNGLYKKFYKKSTIAQVNYTAPTFTYDISATPNHVDYTIKTTNLHQADYAKVSCIIEDQKYETDLPINQNKVLSLPLQSSKAQDVHFSVKYYTYGSNYAERIHTHTLPAYRPLKELWLENVENADTKVLWTIDELSGGNEVDGGDFIIERKIAQDGVFEEIATVRFNSAKTNYEYIDPTGEEFINDLVVYRVYRERPVAWVSTNSKEASIYKEMRHIDVLSGNVQLISDSNQDIARVSWIMESPSINNTWTAGTKVFIKQKNTLTGDVSEVELTEGDLTKGYYDHIIYQMCQKYDYYIHVKTGNINYQLKEKKLSDEPIIITSGGRIETVIGSKGYYADRTEITWYTNNKTIENFFIQSRLYDPTNPNAEFKQIGTSKGVDGQRYYSFNDDKGIPGEIYEYRIIGQTSCADEALSVESDIARGFRSPTGVISGRITYEYGDAVPNVDVKLYGKDIKQGQSIYFSGTKNSFLETDSLLASPNTFTAQAFIKPIRSNQNVTFIDFASYQVGLQDGKLAISANYGLNWTIVDNKTISTNRFTQFSAIYDGTNFQIYLDSTLVKTEFAMGNTTFSESSKIVIGKNFDGYIDEIRLWDAALSKTQVEQTYNRYLSGEEANLMAYWRLDDIVYDEFYDISNKKAKYNSNHGKAYNVRLATATEEIPTTHQLSLRGLTDHSGNYLITGVPYVGNSTAYTVSPTHEIFSFSPSEQTIVLGPDAVTMSNINFVNETAVTVSGYVFFENSSIPVKGASFYVNDQVVISNGDLVQSDEKGFFTISVPVGQQNVRIEKSNHYFKNNGRLLDSKGNNLDYQNHLSNVRFWDQTKVKLIGRVAGGTVEANKKLGFSLSKNNLGDHPKLVLKLEGDNTSYIYDKNAVYKDGQLDPNAPEQMDSLVVHWNDEYSNTVSYKKQSIDILLNEETGEYEALLYPVKYSIIEATAKGWDNMLTSNQVVDLSNAFFEQTEVYTDTSNIEHTLMYHEKFTVNKRIEPSIAYKQGNLYKTEDYFGLTNMPIPQLDGSTADTLKLYDEESQKYTFGQSSEDPNGLPVFQTGDWGFHINATENYAYNGITEGENIQIDKVPVQGGSISIVNGFSTDNTPVKAELNDLGYLYLKVKMDKPKFVNNDLGKLEIAVEINSQVYTAPVLKGILLGNNGSEGSDFVTAGPITLLNILRDPPGSASYSWWESGQSYSYFSETAKGFVQTGEEVGSYYLGTEISTGTGLGAFVMNDLDNENNVTVGVEHEEQTNSPQARTMTVTMNSRYQTSDDPLNVGADADVYIGFSNNLFYGLTNTIKILDTEGYNAISGDKEYYYEVIQGEKTYYICKSTDLSIASSASTLFAYPQKHIEEKIIPDLEKLRNQLILPKEEFDDSEAQAMANAQNRVIFLSRLSSNDPNFGSSNDNNTSDGHSYKGFIPSAGLKPVEINMEVMGDVITVIEGTPDSLHMYNQAIKEWIRVLKQNEDEKLAAIEKQDLIEKNRSFHAAAPMEYTESFNTSFEKSYNYDFVASAMIGTDLGFTINGLGFVASTTQKFGGTEGYAKTESEENTVGSGFVLVEEGDYDYISVDVLRAAPVDTTFLNKWDEMYGEVEDDPYDGNGEDEVGPDHLDNSEIQYGNFIFVTRGGATACPYEPASYTKYQEGSQQKLADGTIQIENPAISTDNSVVSNVPSDQAAVYNLKLMNESEVSGATAIFTIAMVDETNQGGAKLSIDGVPLGEGRGIEVPYGEVLNKVLEVRKGIGYEYEDLAIVLKSQCQSDPTDYQADIADTVYISAYFTPTASPIDIASPNDSWTMNTSSAYDDELGKYYIPLEINNYDVNFTDFHHIDIQYKASFASDAEWTTIRSYYKDEKLFAEASGEKQMIEGASIYSRFYGAEDQAYNIRALSYSLVGSEFVTKSSAIISGVKDTQRPVLFGNAQPADGVLDSNDDIRLTFNEQIAEGYMTNVKNFEVTAIRNGSQGDHSTSLTFDGSSDYISTEAERNLSNKDFSIELWMQPAHFQHKMTLFSHGYASNRFEIALDTDKTIKVTIGSKEYASKPIQLNAEEWRHIAISYKASNQQLSVFDGGVEIISGIQTNAYTGTGVFVWGKNSQNSHYFAGKMHEIRLWSKALTAEYIMANKSTIYTGTESGMLAYYPVNEGKGNRLTDKAQGLTAHIKGAEWSTEAGLSLAFSGNQKATVNTSKIALTEEDNYTLQFWFKAEKGQNNATLLANGKAEGEEMDGTYNKVFVGFENGKLVFKNNDYKAFVEGNWMDDNWHQFTISVNRHAGNAQIFLDGKLSTYFDANLLGGFMHTQLHLGARQWGSTDHFEHFTDQYLKGEIDELVLWNMALPANRIEKQFNRSPKGNEMGLMLYLPCHKYIRNGANVVEMVYSGVDLVSKEELLIQAEELSSTEDAPMLAKGPEVDIPFSFVVNNDALVVNLLDTPEALENSLVNITVKEVADMNGNLLKSPITWTVYINQNQLRWDAQEIVKTKAVYETMSFETSITNEGGVDKKFNIEGLPSWLNATPSSGEISALSTQKIVLTVDPNVNVGQYNEIVYVRGENNIAEPLAINLKVNGEKPNWEVNPNEFSYSMNVSGRLRFNGIFSADSEDVIAAFIDGKCVGISHNTYQEINDMWYTFLTVYANQASAENIEFRMWDASTGLIYQANPSQEISFKSDQVVGSITSPIIFDAEQEYIQNIALKKGWNWISFNLKNEKLNDLQEILKKNTWGKDDLVKDETTATFASYLEETKSWYGTLTDHGFNNQNMYLVKSEIDQVLALDGTLLSTESERSISLKAGWNYISYLPNKNLSIAEALADYEAQEGDIIKSQNQFAMYGEGIGWIGNLTSLQANQGYLFFRNTESTEVITFTYPSSEAVSFAARMANTALITDHRFANTMSAIATVKDGFELQEGDQLVAYANGELRNLSTLNHQLTVPDLFFMSIGGQENEIITFALKRNDEIIAQTNQIITYSANKINGTLIEPMELDFQSKDAIRIYPNPFQESLNIFLETEKGDQIQISIYDQLGRLVHQHQAESKADHYQYKWAAHKLQTQNLYLVRVSINGITSVHKVIKH